MTSESAFPAQEAVVATDVLRFRGGRRPFLTKKRLGANNDARDGAEENERENHDWWSQRVTQVRDWLRSNPLHLGLDDMAVKTLQQMLREGDSLHVNDARKLKCWLHICIELGDVPGSPLHHDDKIDSEIKARARLKDGHRVSLLAPGSPETCEDEDLAQPTIPTIGAEARLRLEEVEASSGRGNNATPSPRHAATQTEPGSPASQGQLTASGPQSMAKRRDSEANSPAANVSAGASSLRRAQGRASAKSDKSAAVRRQKSERRVQRVRPSRLDRRKTEADLTTSPRADGGSSAGQKLRRAGNAVLGGSARLPRQDSTNLLSMSLIERQDYLLKRKKEREQRLRDQQSQKETEECTHRPSTFTRKNSFPDIESVIKHDPGATWSESPTNRKRRETASSSSSSSSNSNAQSRERLVAEVAEPPSGEADDTTTERKKIPLLRQRSVSRMEELASCTSALLDACKLDLMNRANAETRFAAGENEAKDQGNSGVSSEGAADAAAHEASMIPSAREERKYRFANNSTADKGKVQVQDHADFQLDSFYRKRDRGSAKPGVSLLMGRREDDLTEQVVAVIFDRARFEEADADDWMHRNIHRFPVGRRELIDKARNEAKT